MACRIGGRESGVSRERDWETVDGSCDGEGAEGEGADGVDS